MFVATKSIFLHNLIDQWSFSYFDIFSSFGGKYTVNRKFELGICHLSLLNGEHENGMVC